VRIKSNEDLSRRAFLATSANYAGLGLLTLALNGCGGSGQSSVADDNETINAAKNINKSDSYDFMEQYDVCIVGGGSSGVGAAFSLRDSGLKVLVIEKDTTRLGGTGTQAYVNIWAPGPDAPFCRKVAEDLFHAGLASFMSIESHKTFDFYDRTLLTNLHSKYPSLNISFNIDALGNYYQAHIADYSDIWLGAEVVDLVEYNDGVLGALEVLYQGKKGKVSARAFIDCTGNIDVFRMLPGESYYAGEDPYHRFYEPAAPIFSTNVVNAPDLCYRIRINPTSPYSGSTTVLAGFCYSIPPNEGLYVVNPTNTLPLNGSDLFSRGYKYLYDTAVSKVTNHAKNYHQFNFVDNAPMLGIRESYRAKCMKMLCQADTEKLISSIYLDDYIAIADHYYDIHGSRSAVDTAMLNPVSVYGVPYKCIVPVKTRNVLVACRGAGFSHIAASSCRLTKTMMQLGYSAGVAAAIKLKRNIDFSMVDPKDIQNEIGLHERTVHLETIMSI